MADEPITNPTEEDLARAAAYEERLRNINTETKQHTSLVDENTQAQARGSSVIDKSKEAIKMLAQQVGLLSGDLNDFFSNINGFKNLTDFVNRNGDALKELANTGTRSLLVFTNLLPQNIKLFGQLHAEGTKAGLGIADSFETIEPIMRKLAPNFLVSGMGNIVKVADQLQGQQFGLYRTAAATGQLNEFMKGTGDTLAKLEDATARYNKQLAESATANHTTIATMAEYSANLSTIPGALTAVIDAGEKFGGQISILAASTKVANAFMLDHKVVTDIMNQAYQNFGTSADKALQIVSRIGVVSQDLGIPMDIVRQSTMSAAESFKMFGDNTQAALNILESFTPSLRDSGLGPAAIRDVVAGMTDGIAKMDVAHKAFISGATGGRGGLAGAFEIDEMMAKGEVDKVMAMVMNAMQRQFGGPVLERKDVLSNPALAGEFQKQIEFIKSVGGLAGNDIQAQQVLAAMKQGSVTELERVAGGAREEPQEAFAKSVAMGAKVQEKVEQNTGMLVSLTRSIEVQQQAAAVAAQQTVRLLAGRRPGAGGFESAVGESRDAAERTAAGGEAMGGFGRPVGAASRITEDTVMDDANKSLKDAAVSAQRMADSFLSTPQGAQVVKKTPELLNDPSFVKSAASAFGMDATNLTQNTPGFADIQRALAAKFGLADTTAGARTMELPSPSTTMMPAPKIGPVAAAAGSAAATVMPEQVIRLEIDIKDGMEKVAHKTAKIAIENFQARGTAVQPTE